MDYQHLYFLLFSAAEDAIEAIDRQNYGIARECLIRAQQKAEEFYVTYEEQTE